MITNPASKIEELSPEQIEEVNGGVAPIVYAAGIIIVKGGFVAWEVYKAYRSKHPG